jgi:regulator of protease activity HflC (stomatin/prohibitin superfamily)
MSSDVQPPSSKVAERLAVIVDAAERAALSVIDDAQKEAKRYLEDAQARADQIVAERLREAADALERQGAAPAEPTLRPVADEPGTREPEPQRPEPEPLRPVAPPRNSGSSAARLLATQMAVSGNSRAEIETQLRNGFDIEDTSEILDAILGPEE